ncbi:MAG: hypothetical protein H0T89_23115 [Deltaproteobacteria bacterium]|nr:hypothetical protein [Deltaproteobacteria bacterium]MDQ3295007.1 immunity 21 family protein [Myxococcota bacterium]
MPAAVVGSCKLVGAQHATSGPLAIVPQMLHAKWVARFTEQDGKALGKLKKRVSAATTKGARGVFLPLVQRMGCYAKAGVIVLVEAKDANGKEPASFEEVMKAATQVDVKDTAWKPVMKFTPKGAHVLCDVWAKNPTAAKADRKRALKLNLSSEPYVVEEIRNVAHTVNLPNQKPLAVKYSFTRLRPVAQKALKIPKPKLARVVASEIVAPPEIVKAAKQLKFIDSDQTTMVIVPRASLNAWGGLAEDGEDTRDFDRACAAGPLATLDVDGRPALVIGQDAGMAFHPTDDGGVIIQWIGADSEAGILSAALSIPADQWKPTKLRWNVGDGELVMIGAPTPGKCATCERVDIKIPPGTYALETCERFRADVRVGKQLQPTLLGAVRLVKS